VYKKCSKNNQWKSRIVNAFTNNIKKGDEYVQLKDAGFLLIDLFPYPAEFNKVCNRVAYKKLIDLSVKIYLPELLRTLNGKLTNDVKIAFAMKRYGNYINNILETNPKQKGYEVFGKKGLNSSISRRGGKLYKNGKNEILNKLSVYENVIADGSGNPNPALMQYAFDIEKF